MWVAVAVAVDVTVLVGNAFGSELVTTVGAAVGLTGTAAVHCRITRAEVTREVSRLQFLPLIVAT